MKDKILTVASGDSVLIRMIEVEAAFCGYKTEQYGRKSASEGGGILLIDLDSVNEPFHDADGFLCTVGIGYDPHSDKYRPLSDRCHYLLKRPFLLSSFRSILTSVLSAPEQEARDVSDSIPVLNRRDLTVKYCGKSLSLSPNEARILELLLSRIGTPVSREEMAVVVGETASNKVDVYVCYLRRKLESLSGMRLIKSVRKVGYLIDAE